MCLLPWEVHDTSCILLQQISGQKKQQEHLESWLFRAAEKKLGFCFFFLHEFILGWVVLELPLLLGDFFFSGIHPWSSTGFKHGSAVRICPCKMKIPNLATNQNHFQVPFLKHLGCVAFELVASEVMSFQASKMQKQSTMCFFSAKILQYFALVIRTRNIIFKCSHSYIHTDLHVYMCVHTHLYSLHVHMPCSLRFYLS